MRRYSQNEMILTEAKKKSEPYTMVKVTSKSGKFRGYLTPDQFKQAIDVTYPTQRSVADLCKDYSKKSDEANFEVVWMKDGKEWK